MWLCWLGFVQVVAAITKQLATLNTNARYLHEGLCTYAEQLTSTFPEPLSVRPLVAVPCTDCNHSPVAMSARARLPALLQCQAALFLQCIGHIASRLLAYISKSASGRMAHRLMGVAGGLLCQLWLGGE